MKDLMEYKGYYGSVHYSDDDEIFYGKLEFISSLVNFEGTNVKSLQKAFRQGVDDYLSTCKEENLEPEQPFKGNFNIRTGSDLHRKLVFYANKRDLSVNKVVIDALENYLKQA